MFNVPTKITDVMEEARLSRLIHIEELDENALERTLARFVRT